MLNELTALALEKAQAILGARKQPHRADGLAGRIIFAYRCVAEEKVMLL
jgi:hypothetical protein